jgi:hypothetical protein
MNIKNVPGTPPQGVRDASLAGNTATRNTIFYLRDIRNTHILSSVLDREDHNNTKDNITKHIRLI